MDYSKPRGSKSVESFFDTMKSSFTDDEWLTIKAEDEEEKRLKEFYRHWSLKESYIKAIGYVHIYEICYAAKKFTPRILT
mmetsp:Transcript_13268/g.16515  ORF Transcript_13268/g.16515 Transcript_13268/m.16515 type:complete len:80 (-) Transcript_13268:988-1227(-)